ncbi:CDP-alcohol phosphatidyltransferase family protein [Desulfosoma sp.]|uniref:CDP-alcohol phosphatidyltransferase family protein n=1 Tax=Desulfosoma sp. TaxID=2603217 RepID=UPI004048F05E
MSAPPSTSWQTKPTDRFILRWIKVHLSARLTPRLASMAGIHPWMITVASSTLGVLAGLVFGTGWAFGAGCLAALGQVLDGVDGQLARLRGMETPWGAFWDSTLDRYGDGALIVGMSTYVAHEVPSLPLWGLVPLATAALIGGNLVSYTTARAQNLGLDLGPPTLASKGTRTSMIIVSAWAAVFWKAAPLAGLLALAGISNAVVLRRLMRVRTAAKSCMPASEQTKHEK